MQFFIGLILSVLTLCNVAAYAGDPLKGEWESGQVTLNNGEILQGDIQFNLHENIVMVKANEQTRAFSAHVVKSFFITNHKAPRKYLTLSYDARSRGNSKPMFFQLVFDGEFTLLVREYEVHEEAINSARVPMTRRYSQKKTRRSKIYAHDYFAKMPDGSFQEVSASRNELCRLFSFDNSGSRVINRYISDEDIDFTRQPDIIKLIHHFTDPSVVAQISSDVKKPHLLD